MTTFLTELEQDPFDGEEFIERLAWRATNGRFDDEAFDPELLHEAFENGIKDLKAIYDQNQKKTERLEMLCREEEKGHWIRTAQLQQKCKDSFANFEKLEKRLDVVADKVVYLGEQLEGVNTPRTRAVEAQVLMQEFANYLHAPKDDPNANPFEELVFEDIQKLYDEADIIQKLYLISQELPNGKKFDKAKNAIAKRYDNIERYLIEEFVQAHKNDDKEKMKKISNILSQFKGYSHCVNAFIEQSQMGIFLGENLFNDIISHCKKNQKVIVDVFSNSEQVMSKFVLNIFHCKIQEYISSKLDDSTNEEFLTQLHSLYQKTNKLIGQISKHRFIGCDYSFLNKISQKIFEKYLERYVETEKRFLYKKCEDILSNYYDSLGHQKRAIPQGIQEILQSKITRQNNAHPDQKRLKAGETLLSEEIAISILQESKRALQRCSVLSKNNEMADNALELYKIELNYLCNEHMEYAIELGLQVIPPNDPKVEPSINFYQIVRQSNEISHLIEKQFISSVLPLISSPTKYNECLKIKQEVTSRIESKLNQGIEKCTACVIGWIKRLFAVEQKATDFKPDESEFVPMCTEACKKVVKFINLYLDKILPSFDGNNRESILQDLGLKIHRTILDHFQQYQFNTLGGMVAICDLREYRNCTQKFKIPLLDQLFQIFHDLCNLLVVNPENLSQISSGNQFESIDKVIVQQFISLRLDSKSTKISNFFK